VYQQCTNRQKVKNSQRQLKQHKITIGVPIVTCLPTLYQPCTNSVPKTVKNSQNSKNDHWCTNRHRSTKTVPTVYQSSKVKNSQRQLKHHKITIGVPIVTCLPRLYQPCTNSVPKTVKKTVKTAKKWPLVYQSSHVYTESAEYRKSASASAEYTKPFARRRAAI